MCVTVVGSGHEVGVRRFAKLKHHLYLVISAAVNDLSQRRRNSVRQRWAASAAKTRVAVSIALAIAACWLSRPTLETLFVGWPVAFAGIALRAWAAGHLRKNQQLAVSGPYAYVRNPALHR